MPVVMDMPFKNFLHIQQLMAYRNYPLAGIGKLMAFCAELPLAQKVD
jgi:hypothetical protein